VCGLVQRVMHNTMLVCTDLKETLIPQIAAKSNAASEDPNQIAVLQQQIDDLHNESHEGFEICCQAIALRQLAAGTYRPVMDAVRLRKYIAEGWAMTNMMTIRIHPTVPDWIMVPKLLLSIVIRNALHNAGIHGEKDGRLLLSISLDGDRLLFQLQNQAGPQHKTALQMQSKLGHGMVFDKSLDLGSIGTSASTFLGMGEIQQAANAMGATATLVFHDAPTDATAGHVVFGLQMKLVLANAVPDMRAFRGDAMLVCADDSKIFRLQYQMVAKLLQARASYCAAVSPQLLAYRWTILSSKGQHLPKLLIWSQQFSMRQKSMVQNMWFVS